MSGSGVVAERRCIIRLQLCSPDHTGGDDVGRQSTAHTKVQVWRLAWSSILSHPE
jgi:hypothetical protein